MIDETVDTFFFFRIGGKTYSFNIPGVGNYVVSGKYSSGYMSGESKVTVRYILARQLEINCFKQVVGMSLCKAPRLERHIGGLLASIEDHIEQQGYLPFETFILLLDSFACILEAENFTDSAIRKVYRQLSELLLEFYKKQITKKI